MVQIPEEVQDILENEEDKREDFDAMPEDHYLAQVVKIEEKPGTEYPYLEIEWKIQQPREFKGRKVWDNISFNPKAAFKVRALFDAFDYDYDSDTDEFVENKETAVLYLSQEIQEKGKNKGKLRNKVDEVFPPDEENMELVGD